MTGSSALCTIATSAGRWIAAYLAEHASRDLVERQTARFTQLSSQVLGMLPGRQRRADRHVAILLAYRYLPAWPPGRTVLARATHRHDSYGTRSRCRTVVRLFANLDHDLAALAPHIPGRRLWLTSSAQPVEQPHAA